MEMMKKLLITTTAFIFLQCGDCLHCNEGGSGIFRYSLINKLNTEVLVEIYGENIITQLILHSRDTSKTWDVIVLPADNASKFFTVDYKNNRGSFPYNSDSILVKIDQDIVMKYYESDDYTTEAWTNSIYNELSYLVIPPEELPPNEVVSSNENAYLFYYSLDSVNLDLK